MKREEAYASHKLTRVASIGAGHGCSKADIFTEFGFRLTPLASFPVLLVSGNAAGLHHR